MGFPVGDAAQGSPVPLSPATRVHQKSKHDTQQVRNHPEATLLSPESLPWRSSGLDKMSPQSVPPEKLPQGHTHVCGHGRPVPTLAAATGV